MIHLYFSENMKLIIKNNYVTVSIVAVLRVFVT